MLRLFAVALVGCTGFSLGENTPGGDTWTEPPPVAAGEHKVGAIAVQRGESQLWVVHDAANADGVVRAHLAAIDPVTGTSTDVLDVSGTEDRRVVFPAADRMLLFAQAGDRDSLVLIDTTSRTVVASAIASTWYWGTRTAPSGHTVIVADNSDPHAALHAIDTATLAHQVIPHGGDLIEAMWDHNSDTLLALSVVDPFGPNAAATVLRYDLSSGTPTQTLSRTFTGFGWDFAFSFTWIGVSPDDHWAVFPVVRTDGQADLLVLDQTTDAITRVPGLGPVGFTRDSQRIVSYGPNARGDSEDLWLIDPVTHATTVVPTAIGGGINFFPMHDSDDIAVTPAFFGAGPLVVYDAVTAELRTAATDAPRVELVDFVTRPGELFAESAGQLYDVQLADASIDALALPESIANINVRPSANQAVTAATDTATIYRLDLDARAVVGDPIHLPSPFASTPPMIDHAKPTRATRRPHGPVGDAIRLR